MESVRDLEAWLESAVNRERTGAFGDIRIEAFKAFLARLPPAPAPCTVGGTKGKGSTVRLIEAALLADGAHTIAFTSPHVHAVTERWRIDGVPATVAELAPCARRVAAEEQAAGTVLSYFERTAAIAVLLAAARPGCHLLWEVGLGGRLDCANAFDCRVAVLTHLSHDHRDVLGPTLGHIAREKLPIARAGRPLLIAPQSAEGAAAIRDALANGAAPGARVQWIGRHPRPFTLALPGSHQQDSASTALAAARELRSGLDEERARTGMGQARLAARCQLIAHGDRRILVDGAHNGPSIAATIAVAREHLRPGWRLVLGLATDKEIAEVAAVLPVGVDLRRCGYASPRARGEADWPPELSGTPWHDDVRSALAALPAGDVCITGSFYLAGEALNALGAEAIPG